MSVFHSQWNTRGQSTDFVSVICCVLMRGKTVRKPGWLLSSNAVGIHLTRHFTTLLCSAVCKKISHMSVYEYYCIILPCLSLQPLEWWPVICLQETQSRPFSVCCILPRWIASRAKKFELDLICQLWARGGEGRRKIRVTRAHDPAPEWGSLTWMYTWY